MVALSLVDGEQHTVVQDAFSARYLPSGHLVFARGTGLWAAPVIRFKVSGSVETDPEKLLALIGKVAKKKWLITDLTSRRTSRKQEAWWAIHEYGDHRLLPLLEKLVGQGVMKKNLRWGNLRSQPDPPANADKSRR